MWNIFFFNFRDNGRYAQAKAPHGRKLFSWCEYFDEFPPWLAKYWGVNLDTQAPLPRPRHCLDWPRSARRKMSRLGSVLCFLSPDRNLNWRHEFIRHHEFQFSSVKMLYQFAKDDPWEFDPSRPEVLLLRANNVDVWPLITKSYAE